MSMVLVYFSLFYILGTWFLFYFYRSIENVASMHSVFDEFELFFILDFFWLVFGIYPQK